MGGIQILKLVFVVIIMLLAATVFVCNYLLKRHKSIDFRNKEVRLLLRIRVGCFLAMLVLLLLIVLINNGK